MRKKSHVCNNDVEKDESVQPSSVQDVIATQKHPKIIITTKSLPGSIESDEQDNPESCCRGSNNVTKPQSSVDNEPKPTSKLRNWKVPKFFKKSEDVTKSSPTIDSSTGLIAAKLIKANSPANDICGEGPATPIDQNGYQQLPILIETSKPPCNKLDIPHKAGHMLPNSVKSPDGSCCSPSQHSMFDDVIDIRSYISQSRSDISPFGRSGSYRSQCGRSGHSDVSPVGRPRASTLVVERNDILQPGVTMSQSRNIVWPDGLSICPSATSRKDSGIKSNSRRSSIQQQIFALNQSAISQHRVSGYFTSSTSSISNIGECHTIQIPSIDPSMQPISDPLAACLQHLRKQSDLQLIRCVRDNAKSQRSYLVKPPLKRFSLFFKSSQMEKEFRSKAHRFGSENENEGPPTLATPRYNTYIDIFIGIAVYLCISSSLFLMTPTTLTSCFRAWVYLFTIFTAFQVFAIFLFTRQMVRRHQVRSKTIIYSESCADRIFQSISSWYPWHICLAILMAMPVFLIIVNFLLLDLNQLQAFEYHYGFLIFVCIVHFCNFTQLNCWMRNILALMAAMCFVGIAVSQLTVYSNRVDNTFITNSTLLNSSLSKQVITKFIHEEVKWFQDYHVEIYLDLLLLLVLVWLLNREFEIGYRLTFYGNAVANQDKIRVQNMKNQADMLLHNIIPKHVAEHLKNTAKYSENHHNIGIIFASIVNFNEMYDESYLGGKEYLRVLNELIGDFDELLSRTEFRCVEKIKTIGSTFMAASGLDPSNRGDGNEHILALMEFSIAMQSVIEAFNKDLLEFDLVLRIGLNIGDVTAGVIGTSKLHYDIWGDAVNVASRMDSTGVPNRIQVGKDCLPYLQSKYEFEPRGKVYVKGKDNMEVFLYTRRKPGSIYNLDEE